MKLYQLVEERVVKPILSDIPDDFIYGIVMGTIGMCLVIMRVYGWDFHLAPAHSQFHITTVITLFFLFGYGFYRLQGELQHRRLIYAVAYLLVAWSVHDIIYQIDVSQIGVYLTGSPHFYLDPQQIRDTLIRNVVWLFIAGTILSLSHRVTKRGIALGFASGYLPLFYHLMVIQYRIGAIPEPITETIDLIPFVALLASEGPINRT